MRGVRAIAGGAVMLGTVMAARAGEAAVQTEWHSPFGGGGAGLVAVGDGAVHFIDFDAQSSVLLLGTLEPNKGQINEMRLPYFSPMDLRVRPGDGAPFLVDINTTEIAQADVHHRELRRWALPPTAFGVRSLTFDDQGRVLFLASSFIEKTAVGRLDTATNLVELWQMPDSLNTVGLDTAWQLVRVADGSVFFNMSGFTQQQVVRLDLDSGVFTSWPLAVAPVFGLATDGVTIYFNEFASGVRGAARLIPATGALTEWTGLAPEIEIGQNIVLEGGQLFFGLGAPPALAVLDPASPGADSVLTPIVADPVVPSTFSVTPVVTTHREHPRSGHSQPDVSVPAATSVGPFVVWSLGVTSRLAGDGAGGVYFGGGTQGDAVVRFTLAP